VSDYSVFNEAQVHPPHCTAYIHLSTAVSTAAVVANGFCIIVIMMCLSPAEHREIEHARTRRDVQRRFGEAVGARRTIVS